MWRPALRLLTHDYEDGSLFKHFTVNSAAWGGQLQK